VAADIVPIAGEIYDAYELAQTVADFVELHADAEAAILYVQGGPRALDALRLSLEDEGFSSFGAFAKDEWADELEKRFGRAPTGYDYHHIVEQGGTNAKDFAPDVLNSTENIVKIPKYLHEEINVVYGSPAKEAPTMSLRQWLRGQPYDVQRYWGIKVMRGLRIIK
jgi:hypothetical protein